METVDTLSGRAIAFEQTGEGRPLVLVHQGFADRSVWARMLPHLAPDFTVYAVDRLGHGDSDPYPPDARLEDEYEAVAAVLRRIDAPVFLMGHSSGALTALHVAAAHPAAVAKLILYEPPGFYPPNPDLKRRLLAAHAADDFELLVKLAVVDYVGGATGEQPPLDALKQSRLWPTLMRNAHSVYAEILTYAAYQSRPEQFETFRIPTALFVGAESPAFLRDSADALHQMLTTSVVVWLEGQGHLAHFSAPELLARHMRQFFL